MKTTTPTYREFLPFFLSAPSYRTDSGSYSYDQESLDQAVQANQPYQVAAEARKVLAKVMESLSTKFELMAPRSLSPDSRLFTDDLATLVIRRSDGAYRAIRFLDGATFDDIPKALEILAGYSGVLIPKIGPSRSTLNSAKSLPAVA